MQWYSALKHIMDKAIKCYNAQDGYSGFLRYVFEFFFGHFGSFLKSELTFLKWRTQPLNLIIGRAMSHSFES